MRIIYDCREVKPYKVMRMMHVNAKSVAFYFIAVFGGKKEDDAREC